MNPFTPWLVRFLTLHWSTTNQSPTVAVTLLICPAKSGRSVRPWYSGKEKKQNADNFKMKVRVMSVPDRVCNLKGCVNPRTRTEAPRMRSVTLLPRNRPLLVRSCCYTYYLNFSGAILTCGCIHRRSDYCFTVGWLAEIVECHDGYLVTRARFEI